tara:strand:- start:146 stop:316 length:171 start_codon:yes stop_codon:yes gene_type:complete
MRLANAAFALIAFAACGDDLGTFDPAPVEIPAEEPEPALCVGVTVERWWECDRMEH